MTLGHSVRNRYNRDVVILGQHCIHRVCRTADILMTPMAALAMLVLSTVTIRECLDHQWIWKATHIGEAIAALIATACGLLLHEVGHATAASRHGRQVQSIGITLYRGVMPAFYVDLGPQTDRVTRASQIELNLAGVYFEAIWAVLMLLIAIGAQLPALAITSGLLLLDCMWNLVPLPGQDGDHLLQALRRKTRA